MISLWGWGHGDVVQGGSVVGGEVGPESVFGFYSQVDI